MARFINLSFLLISIVVLNSCKKSTNNRPTSGYFLNATINGQAYSRTDAIYKFMVSDQEGCVPGKLFETANISQIDVSSYFLDVFIHHYQNDIDFRNTPIGNYGIFDMYNVIDPNACNMDLGIGLEDRAFSSGTSSCELLPNSLVNRITRISLASETADNVKYDVEGTFSCSFKNEANTIINVTGDYRTFFVTLK